MFIDSRSQLDNRNTTVDMCDKIPEDGNWYIGLLSRVNTPFTIQVTWNYQGNHLFIFKNN